MSDKKTVYTEDFRNQITWEINERCNFQCDYCIQSRDKNKNLKPININKLSQGLDCLQGVWRFHISGGEPFLEKNFVELSREITKKHYLSISTNLSTSNVFDFADEIHPKKTLSVLAALHITEREKRDKGLRKYIEKMLYLQKKGFNVVAYYVAHPVLFDRIKSDFEFLKSKGIQKVRVKIFYGMYNGNEYPSFFSPNQKDFLENIEADYPEFEILYKTHKYHGQLCLAGQRLFVMDRNGDLRRCHSTLKNYGNLFEKSIKNYKKSVLRQGTTIFRQRNAK